MNTGIQDIKINPNWLYHRVTGLNIDQFILSGSIKAKRYLREEIIEEKNVTWNGNYYISLAKYRNGIDFSYDSCYPNFIDSQYAFVIEDVEAIQAKQVENHISFYLKFAKLPIKKRYSHYLDEYQVKREISLDKVVGIKIPSKNPVYSYLCPSYTGPNRGIDFFLEKMESVGGDFPFIDIEEKKVIEKEKIKEYIKRMSSYKEY